MRDSYRCLRFTDLSTENLPALTFQHSDGEILEEEGYPQW